MTNLRVRAFVCAAILCWPVAAKSQTVSADRFRLNTGPCVLSSGAGSPEGVVTATCGYYYDTTSRAMWTKVSGTGNTGWSVGFNTAAIINGTTLFKDTSSWDTAGAGGQITWGTINGASAFGIKAGSGRYLNLGANGGTGDVVIDTSQRVGIGTTNPAAKLHVAGDSAKIKLTGGTYTSIEMQDGGTGDPGYFDLYRFGVLQVRLSPDVSYFNTGNVGIGTADPSAPLDVVGRTTMTGAGTTSGTYTAVLRNATPANIFAFRDDQAAFAYGSIGSPDYVSQLTDWSVTKAGAGDFRYLFADEMHVKVFIADLEQALAGAQLICKSVTPLGAVFTNPGGPIPPVTMTVEDLPGQPNTAVFVSGDTVGLRNFSRSGGGVSIADTYGVVTSYADQADGMQTWTFTRNDGADGGSMATSATVAVRSIVIDYGTSGNGCHEVSAVDGAYAINSPYNQTWTWVTAPTAAHRTLRTRVGNLLGVTGTSNEYGGLLGTYSASPTGSTQYVRASSAGLSIVGGDLRLYAGSTNTVTIDHSVPSIALGATVPSAYGTGTGIWMGNDGGTTKFRVGDPAISSTSAGLFEYNGTNVTLSNSYFRMYSGCPSACVQTIAMDPTVPSIALGATVPSAYGTGTGIWMGNDGGTYKFRVGDPAGNRVSWDGSTLAVVGDITATAGAIGGWDIVSGNIQNAPSGDTFRLSSAEPALTIGATLPGYNSGTGIWMGNDSGTYKLFIGVSNGNKMLWTGDALEITGTITASTIDGSTITAGSGDEVTIAGDGITIAGGAGNNNKIKWGNGPAIWGSTASMSEYLTLSSDILSLSNVQTISTYLDPDDSGFHVIPSPSSNGRFVCVAPGGTLYLCQGDEGFGW